MGWLVERLTPYKQDQRRWYDLAVALEQYWDTYNTPALERIEQMRSVFTADDEDVESLLREAGVQFEVAIPIVRDNLAFAYSWRAYEIHRKDRHETLEQILRRDYSGVFIRWLPLYAPKDVPYGERFLTEQEIEFSEYSRDDLYQTYRGAVQVNLSGLQINGVSAEGFAAAVRRKLDVLRPAHIVYDGEYFFQAFRAEFEVWLRNGGNHHGWRAGRLLFSMLPLFDDIPADDIALDKHPVSSAHLTRWMAPAAPWREMPLWGLDAGSHADGTYWPLPGIEGERHHPAGTLGHWHQPASRILGASDIAAAVGGREQGWVGQLFAMQRFFDVTGADEAALDYEPIHSARLARTLSGAASWGTMPPWGLDGGSSTPDGHWPLPGVEGQQRSPAGLLGSAILHAATVPAKASGGVARGESGHSTKPVIFTMHRYFDDLAADAVSLDQQPVHEARHTTRAAVPLRPWAGRPPWRLDLGAITPDGIFPTPGVEGDKTDWIGHAGSATRNASTPLTFYLKGSKNGEKPTFQAANWLQFVTEPALSALSVQGNCHAAQDGEHYASAASVARTRTAPEMPCMDDVPADFAPLDMSYEAQL